MKKIFFLILILLIPLIPVSSDESYSELVPGEYNKDEFPSFLRDIRRAEVIFVGSYPFSVLFTKLGTGIYDYASSGFDRNNAPSMFGGTENSSSGNEETSRILITSLYVSLSITALDYFIGKIKERKKNENKRNY